VISEPVLKDLEGAKKTHKIAGVALETRQGVILGATFVVYSLICYYLAGLFGIDTTIAALAFCWVVPLAFVFAFFRHDGRHLDFWLARKYLAMTRPDVMVQTQPDPTKALRNSVQRALPAERFWWEMLGCKDGTYLVAFEVEPVGLSLVGETERQRVYAAAIELYNRVDFEIVEFVRSKEGSTARYTRRLRRTVSGSIRPEERKLKAYANRHLSYLEEIVPSYNIFERKGYLILPYNPRKEGEAQNKTSAWAELKKLFGIGGKPSEKDAKRRQAEAEASYRVLSGRAQIVHEGFVRMGCRIRALTDLELTSFLKEQTTSWQPDTSEAEPNLYNPVTLEHAGYEMLSEEERGRVALAADEVREDAPIAFAMGELSVAEKIAPDAVRIYPDYLRVEDSYHTTLYVAEWADEVYFGMFEALTHIEGRVKLVKYVTPQPKDKALKILGARLAALRAAERTADDGNVASAQQREISRFTNEVAMRELTSDRQRYLEVSCLVHVEADTEEELSGVVDEVRTALAQYRTEAKLCREEAWEGFLSCLPLGRIWNSERYLKRGMLSRPAACLFSYGTHQIDHERGVFVGIDQASGGPITLDNRRLMNPHSVIIGQTGGGKTFVVKCLSTRQRMLGRRIVIVDPESNSKYAKVAKEIGGEFALIAPGSPHKINPFDLHDDYLNIGLLEDVAEEGDEDAGEAYARARSAALNGKAQEITRMVSLMLSSDSKRDEGLSGAEAGRVERAVYEAYDRKGITRDPATHHNEPPTFVDFFAVLAEYAGNSPEVAGLHEKLYSWHSGALSTLFDSRTNVDLSNKFLVFQISKVKGRQKAPVMHAVLEFMNGVLSNPDEAAECYIDEAWSILKDPMAAEFAETMWRSARARNCGMCAISQQPIEFFGSDQGKVILALSATHMIFRHDQRQPAAATASYYDFSEEETQGLLNLQAGEGYLVVGQTRVPLKVMASAEEEELFNTKPKSEEHQREDELEIAASPTRRELPDDPRVATKAVSTLHGWEGKDGVWRPYASVPDSREWADPVRRPIGHGPAPLNFSWGETPTRVFAFVGEGAPETASRVAELFAEAAHEEGAYVLALDAAGGEFFGRLSNEETVTPDPYLRRGEVDPDRLAPHVASVDGFEALKAVAPPADADLPAFALVEAAREIFDVLCVVACDPKTSYASDWLYEADRVVGCSRNGGTRDALTSALKAEEVRGKNGTLLCTSAPLEEHHGAAPLYVPELDGRRHYALGGEGGERAVLELAAALASPESAAGGKEASRR
jgi:hypothetical protein